MSSEDEKLGKDHYSSQLMEINPADFEIVDDCTKHNNVEVNPMQSCEKHDEALDLLESNGRKITYVSAQDDARVLRKIDRNIMPILLVLNVFQYLDKQMLNLSSVFGLSRETGLVGDDYSLLGSIVYIAELIFQPLSAYLLVKLRVSRYAPIIVTCWGITLTCMAAARHFHALLISRFFLGVCEASMYGVVTLTIQTWYRRREQGVRIAVCYSNTGLGNIIGTLIMFGVGHIKSSLYSYQIASLILGGMTIAMGLLSFSLFPDNPVRSKFLTRDEKLVAVERIRANQQGLEVKVFKVNQVYEMIFDIKSWCWIFISVAASIPGAGISTFGPLIIRGFGFDGDTVMLLLLPYGVMQLCWLALGFWANQRFHTKWIIIVLCVIPCLVSTTILLCMGRTKKDQPILLLAFYLLSPFNNVVPTIVNWQTSNVAGHTKKNATTALMAMGIMSGHIIGPLLFNSQDKPYYYRRGIISMMCCFGACVIMALGIVVYLRYLNEWNRKRRIARGKAGKIVDYSMLSAAATEGEHAKNRNPDTGMHAFDDLTDLQNDEFIYVY